MIFEAVYSSKRVENLKTDVPLAALAKAVAMEKANEKLLYLKDKSTSKIVWMMNTLLIDDY